MRKRGARNNVSTGDEIPEEKWLVAFRNPASRKSPEGSVFIRQFYAPGYYEAYDAVLTFAEQMKLEVLWFREKRSCEPYVNTTFPGLESVCRYCNKKFGHVDPVPCVDEDCGAEFCSRECMAEHHKLKH